MGQACARAAHQESRTQEEHTNCDFKLARGWDMVPDVDIHCINVLKLSQIRSSTARAL